MVMNRCYISQNAKTVRGGQDSENRKENIFKLEDQVAFSDSPHLPKYDSAVCHGLAEVLVVKGSRAQKKLCFSVNGETFFIVWFIIYL